MSLKNQPKIRMGIVAVSRDCFPKELSAKRTERVVAECKKIKLDIVPCSVIIESENDAMKAVAEMTAKGANAVTLYLGNFGPEGPTTIFAQRFGKPFMLIGAAEETTKGLAKDRGDAFCGMLSACLNCGLRNIMPYVPGNPVVLPPQVAQEMAHFATVARVVVGIRNVKVISFGPRPFDFFACNAPIKPLLDLGIEVMENSELDLYRLVKEAEKRKETTAIASDMAKELGKGNQHPEKLKPLAALELALTEFYDKNRGSKDFAIFANKCWPAFEASFGFVPCYVNGRMSARGIPAACEADLYGAVSQYMVQLASDYPVAFLDINNSVPGDMKVPGAAREDLFMGFHCGNAASCLLCEGCAMKHQVIMHRLMEPGKTPDITVGTLEGRLKPGPVTVFRFSNTPKGEVAAYMIEGKVPDVDPASFGSIGVIACPGFGRFYRHVMLEHQFPHHAAVGFRHAGRVLFDAVKLLGITAYTPLPQGMLYPSENPFSV